MSNAFTLKNGNILLSTEAPGGIYNASQLKKIASLCDKESIIVKATEDHRLALFVNPDKAMEIAEELKSIGLGIRQYQEGLHQPVSCIGELCEDHEQDALGTALDITNELEEIKLNSPLKIGINGCSKCCVPCHTLDISIVGDLNGYRISLGGKNSQLAEMASFMADGVPAAETPRVIKTIVEFFKANAQDGESLQQLIERDGAGPFIAALAPWSQDAAQTGNPFSTETTDAASPEQEVDSFDELDAEPSAEAEAALARDLAEIDETSGLVKIDEQNLIHHPDLAVEEVADSELFLDDTPIDNEAFTKEHAYIVANAAVESSTNLDEISLDAASDQQNILMENDISVADSPHVSLQEVELADELVETMDETSDSFSAAEDLSEQSFESDEGPEQTSGDALLNDDDLSDDEVEISDADQANEASSLNPTTVEAAASFANSESTTALDMQQANVDAGDVLNGPVLEGPLSTASTSDEEDANFIKLRDSIDAHEQETPEDLKSQKNLSEGAQVLDSNDLSMDDNSMSKSIMELNHDGNNDDRNLDSGENFAAEYEEFNDVQSDDLGEDANGHHVADEYDDDKFDVAEHLPLSEIVRAKNFSQKTKSTKRKPWAIASFDTDDQGYPQITWTNGISVTVTQEAIALGKIRIGGNDLRISNSSSGVLIEIDGVRMLLPAAA